jgi:hypothetical protein
MRIDTTGRVGIGTTAPGGLLDLTTTGSTTLDIQGGDGNSKNIIFRKTTGGAQQAKISAVGDDLRFTTGTTTERMRIDSSGNLGIGTSSPAVDLHIENDASTSEIMRIGSSTVSHDTGIYLRTTGTAKISYGSGAALAFYGGGAGTTERLKIDSSGNILAGTDDAQDIGSGSKRFDDIHATNGTIQTSDRNEKQDIAELSDAEQRVAVAAKGLLRKFRWKSAVVEKGDNARTHFGIVAQDLQAAFTAEGLDARDYGMFISSTWTDEETNEEKTRMGVRYSELLAFIISAI